MSHDENQVSRTSGSRSSVPLPHVAQAAGSALARLRDGHVAVRAVPGRDLVAPPELARDAPVADVPHPLVVRLLPELGREASPRPRRSAATAFSASGSIFTNHCSETSGSRTVSQRWQRPTAETWSSRRGGGPRASRSARTFLRASKRSRPAKAGPASAVIFPSKPMTATESRPWRCPASKSFGSCAGVTLTTPVPNFRSTIGSAITGIEPARQRERHRLPDEARRSARRPGGRRRAVSPSIVSGRVVATTSSPSRPRADRRSTRGAGLSTWSTSRSERTVAQRGHQFTIRLVAVGEPLVVELAEGVADRARAGLVERVVLAREVAGAAEAADLVEDVAAARVGPLAAEREERLARRGRAGSVPSARQLPLDDHLRRDARVVDARHPEHRAALHPPPAARTSSSVRPSACPMWSRPVTFGGGITRSERDGVGAGGLGAEEARLLLEPVPRHLEGRGVEGLRRARAASSSANAQDRTRARVWGRDPAQNPAR